MSIRKDLARRQILLVGNPNVGKSSLFHRLSGKYVEVSNYPGTTVDLLQADFEDHKLIDTPGAYSISGINDEEKITKEAVLDSKPGDLILNVVNLLSLERDLFLTLHLIELGIPLILVINQIDAKADFELDKDGLESSLGIPVYLVSAITGEGIDRLKDDLQRDLKGTIGHRSLEVLDQIAQIKKRYPVLIKDHEALLWLEEDSEQIMNVGESPSAGNRNRLYAARRRRLDLLLVKVLKPKLTPKGQEWQEKLNHFLLHPVSGGLTFLLVGFFFLYQVLGVWVAGDLVNLIEKGFFERHWNPAVCGVVAQIFPVRIDFPEEDQHFTFERGLWQASPEDRTSLIDFKRSHPQAKGDYFFSSSDYIERTDSEKILTSSPWKLVWSSIGTILAGRYGLLTLTITYLIGVLMPLVWFFYFSWALLEDSGYLPRLAVLADGFLRAIGLNGRGVIPLVLGLGCVTMAMVTTRLMKSRREQLILMILLAVAVPCSAQLGIIQGLLARIGGLWGWLIWIGVILSVLFLSGLLANKLIPGISSPLILDLPPLRLPRLSNLLYKANHKSWFFLKESGVAFVLASAGVTLLQVMGGLEMIINWMKPLVETVLHLPEAVTLSFLLGMIRRDFGAFGLLDLPLSPTQAVTACVTLTLFVPCIATFGVMIKERSFSIASGIWLLAWVLGFGVGGILTRVLEYLHFS
ncbi:MAG: ferrous iron transporter B [Candidatus Caenarcaniphilales bacterium]|nr:ferrous iron transporter B [Candidatus Caenarcaniphilales bacterium]